MFAENRKDVLELASAALSIATRDQIFEVNVTADSSNLSPCSKKLVYNIQPKETFNVEIVSQILKHTYEKHGITTFMLSSSRFCRSVASLLSAMIDAECVTDAYDIQLEGEAIFATRSVFAGKASAKIRCTLPCILTIKEGKYNQAKEEECEVLKEDFHPASKLEILEVSEQQKSSVDLKSAKIIVSVGRGLKRKEDLSMIEELANLLNGAVGCSRPISSDLGWLPEEHHIGLTGISVRPELYIAIGISGQLQHVAGIKDSKLIAAINTDKSAPIFQACDYGIVGDMYKVIPELIKILKGSI